MHQYSMFRLSSGEVQNDQPDLEVEDTVIPEPKSQQHLLHSHFGPTPKMLTGIILLDDLTASDDLQV